ncbi:MAG: hypothetical protein V8S77_10275 [Oscillospiraceae bacterium]
MTKTELHDNLVFLSALKLLEQLTEKGLLTIEEAANSRTELERKPAPRCCSPEQVLYENSLLPSSAPFLLLLVIAIAEGLW